jgi:predicted nucleic acid-binding Zn ribbon protein
MGETDQGVAALVRIESHERICAERYEEIKYSVRRLERVLITVAGTLILQLIGIVGWLLTHGLK